MFFYFLREFNILIEYINYEVIFWPTGSQGLVGTTILDSYASLYEDNGNSYMLTANTPNQVELSKNSQVKNMNISFTNTVKVQNTGIYKIDYFFSSVASAQSNISIELRKKCYNKWNKNCKKSK